MRYKRKVVLLVAATGMWGMEAKTDERTAAEIVEAARARAERRKQEEAETEKQRDFYFGLGFEDSVVSSFGAVYQLRAVQRDAAALQYLEPVIEEPVLPQGSWAMFIGHELTSWLDVELTAHAMETIYQIEGTTRAATLGAGESLVRYVDADHYSIFKERTYSLTFLPRWQINDWFAAYLRLGAGYADNYLRSKLDSIGSPVYVGESCTTTSDGQQKCTPLFESEVTGLSFHESKMHGFFPVVGVGIQLGEIARLEYIVRSGVPIAGSTTDFGGFYLQFRVKPKWFTPEFINGH